MGFEVGGALGARLRITAPDGSVVLDTDERPALLTKYFEGQVNYPYRTTPRYTKTTNLLGICDLGSTFVFAMAKRVGTNFVSDLPGDRWYNLSGTLTQFAPASYTQDTRYLGHSLVINGTRLELVEDLQMRKANIPGSPQPIDIPAYGLRYRIWVGRFHG